MLSRLIYSTNYYESALVMIWGVNCHRPWASGISGVLPPFELFHLPRVEEDTTTFLKTTPSLVISLGRGELHKLTRIGHREHPDSEQQFVDDTKQIVVLCRV